VPARTLLMADEFMFVDCTRRTPRFGSLAAGTDTL
jgi:hypothetical protein